MAKVFLSSRVEQVTGLLNLHLPFALQRDRNGGVYSRRTQPYIGGFNDSHWKYLQELADMCRNKLYVVEIEVSVNEIAEALSEKKNCHFLPIQILKWTGKKVITSQEFLNLSQELAARGI